MQCIPFSNNLESSREGDLRSLNFIVVAAAEREPSYEAGAKTNANQAITFPFLELQL